MTEAGVNTLLAALARGEESAFAALYDRLGGRLYGAALRILRNTNDAEDAVQEVFVALYRGRQGLASVRDLEAYLFTALRRQTVRCAALRGPPVSLTSVMAEGIEPVGPSAPPEEDRRTRLEKAMVRLPDAQREVLALKIEGELTFAQIADVLGVSANTAASRYRYAIEKLRSLVMEPVQ